MSIFTYHLIEALTGHAQPLAGATEVLVSDVMSYVTRTVPQSARQQAGAAQTPDFQISGNFPVALFLGGKGLSKGEAPPDPAMLNSNPAADRSINTGGGAYIAGNVKVEGGGDFVGRDQNIYRDEVKGNKIVGGDEITVGDISGSTGVAIGRDAQATINHNWQSSTNPGWYVTTETLTIIQGHSTAPPTTQPSHLIEEPIRLDVAALKLIYQSEPFDLAVAVRQPHSPVLSIDELEEVLSSPGTIYRETKDGVVKYRLEISSLDCHIDKSFHTIQLLPGRDSSPVFFQIVCHRAGVCRIRVDAYQEDDNTLAAQTRIRMEVQIPSVPSRVI